MLRNMTIRNRLLGMAVVIVVSVVMLAYFAVRTLEDIYEITSRIYDHPLSVSNSALDASRDVVKMHRDMKDIVLYNDPILRDKVILEVEALEQEVLDELALIKERILGDEGAQLAKEAEEAFISWKPIRDNVIGLVLSDRRADAAQITQGTGAIYVRGLEVQFDELNAYARGMIDQGLAEAEKAQERAIKRSVRVFLVALAAIMLVVFLGFKAIVGSDALRDKKLQSRKDESILLKGNEIDKINVVHEADTSLEMVQITINFRK